MTRWIDANWTWSGCDTIGATDLLGGVMARRSICRRDVDAVRWTGDFAQGLQADPQGYRLTAIEVTAVVNAVERLAEAYQLSQEPGTRAPASVCMKDMLRKQAQATCRPIYLRIKADPRLSANQWVSIGIVPPTAARARVGPPGSVPMLSKGADDFLFHVLRVADSEVAGGFARPRDAIALQLYQGVSDDLNGTDAMEFAGCFTSSPIRLTSPKQ